MKKIIVISLMALLLVGCGTSEDAVQTAIAETEAAKPTLTYTAVPTDTPEPTFTPLPTDTPQPTETDIPTETTVPTEEYTPTPLPPMEDVILTSKELNKAIELWKDEPLYVDRVTDIKRPGRRRCFMDDV